MDREFTVFHEPIGQPRHRVSTRGSHARMYLPSSHPVHGFKKAIQLAFGQKKCFQLGVEIEIQAWFPRPKSKIWKTRQMPAYRHTKKPDIDNVTKAILDALNGLAWVDDAQVCSATIRKYVCDGVSVPRVEIFLRGVEE